MNKGLLGRAQLDLFHLKNKGVLGIPRKSITGLNSRTLWIFNLHKPKILLLVVGPFKIMTGL